METSVFFFFYLILLGVIFYILIKLPPAREDPFFSTLFLSILLLATSGLIDFWHNLIVYRAGSLVFFPWIDFAAEIIQIAGYTLLFSILFKLRRSI